MKIVWDPWVRIGHWALAVAVFGAYALGEHGGRWHERLGYIGLAIVGVRLVWGLFGTRHARFSDFLKAPAQVAEYGRRVLAGTEPRYMGHNPLGGWWIVVMLVLVAAAGASGWALTTLGEHGHHALEELHEGISNALMAAVAVHLVGVAWESLRHRENLVRAMVTGRKRSAG